MGVIRDKCLVDLVDNVDFDKKNFSIYHTDDNSNGYRNRETENNLEDLRSKKVD